MPKSRQTAFARERMLSEINRIFMNEYKQVLESKDIAAGTKDGYCNLILNLLEDIKCDINKVELSILKGFITTGSDNRINYKIGVIQSFLTLVETKEKINFSVSDLDVLRILNKKKKERNATVLNFEQITSIRNILKNEYNRLFVFELIYLHGLELSELVEICKENYNEKENTFILINKSVPLKIDKRIINMINEKPKLLNDKSRGGYQTNIREIGPKIGIRLTWADIIKTRNTYFIRCPKCDELYENTADYWNLVKFQDDISGSMWFICNNCVKEGEF